MAYRSDTGRIAKYEDTDDGFLRLFFRFRKIGDLEYLNLDGTKRIEKVTADDLYKRKALRTASLKPITLNHPAGGMVTPKNARELQRGMTGTTIIRDDPYATIVGVCTDEEMIDSIKAGDIADVSSGYWATVIDGFQTNHKYNHFAGCKPGHGRAGTDVGFLGFNSDSKEQDIAAQIIEPDELDLNRPIIWAPFDFEAKKRAPIQLDDSTPVKKLVKLHGLEVGLQYEPGDTRHGKALPVGYGHIRKHYGADGMALDVYLGENLESEKAFKVRQMDEAGEFDEEKIMLGFDSVKSAEDTYLAVMPTNLFGGIEEISLKDLDAHQKKDSTVTISSIRIDDKTTISVGTSDGEQAIAKYLRDALDTNATISESLAASQLKADKADTLAAEVQAIQTKHDQEKARADMAEAQLAEANKKTDEAATKVIFDQGYQRKELEIAAAKYLPVEVKIDSTMSDRTIKLNVIKHQQKLKTDSDEAKYYDGESDAYVDAAYRFLLKQDSSTGLRIAAVTAQPEEKQDAGEMARAAYIERLRKKKKPEIAGATK